MSELNGAPAAQGGSSCPRACLCPYGLGSGSGRLARAVVAASLSTHDAAVKVFATRPLGLQAALEGQQGAMIRNNFQPGLDVLSGGVGSPLA